MFAQSVRAMLAFGDALAKFASLVKAMFAFAYMYKLDLLCLHV
jgi:hypothetical protein